MSSITIYEHIDFGGKSKTFNRGKYDWIGRSWNDQVSSIRVGSGTTVSYYEDINFGGEYGYEDRDDAWVGSWWNDRISSLLVFDRIQTRQWMSAYIPDSTSLTELSIPGTHDSCTWNTNRWAKCQKYKLKRQLRMGVRFFDIRCREESFLRSGSYLNAYHGIVPLGISFHSVMKDFCDFLRDYPKECIIMCLKNEGDDHADFARSFENEYYNNSNYNHYFYKGTDIPTLGQARGKIVLMRRFPRFDKIGIDATDWKDDAIFSAGSLRVQDRYQENERFKKRDIARSFASEARTGSSSTLYMNFLSSVHWTGPEHIAYVVNQGMRSYFENYNRSRFGIVIMDYVEPGIAALIANTNKDINLFN